MKNKLSENFQLPRKVNDFRKNNDEIVKKYLLEGFFDSRVRMKKFWNELGSLNSNRPDGWPLWQTIFNVCFEVMRTFPKMKAAYIMAGRYKCEVSGAKTIIQKAHRQVQTILKIIHESDFELIRQEFDEIDLGQEIFNLERLENDLRNVVSSKIFQHAKQEWAMQEFALAYGGIDCGIEHKRSSLQSSLAKVLANIFLEHNLPQSKTLIASLVSIFAGSAVSDRTIQTGVSPLAWRKTLEALPSWAFKAKAGGHLTDGISHLS